MAKWLEQVKTWLRPISDDSGRAQGAPQRPLLKRPAWWLTCVLLVWLPFSPFLVTVTGWRGISLVRDLLALALFVIALLSRRRERRPLIDGDVERLTVWLVGWSLVSLILITRDPAAWAWSARYSFVPLAVFWALHSFSITTFQWRKLMTVWLSWSSLLFIFGLVMVFIIPKEMLVAWGYSSSVAIGGGQWVGGASLPAYQAVAGGIPRLQATLTGPIQLAGFAALVFFMLRSAASWQPAWLWQKAMLVLAALMILGTFSRSIWLALLLIGLVVGWRRLRARGFRRRDVAAWGTVAIVGSGAILGLIFSAPNNEGLRFNVGRVLAREGSDQEHAASIKDSLADWRQVGFWGLGFGRSGPGSIQYAAANPKAPLPRFVDDSYLRWWEELGVPGAALFLAFIWILLLELRPNGSAGRNLAGAGLTLALAAILTDMWAEAVPLWTFLALAGLWHQEAPRDLRDVRLGRFTVSSLDLTGTIRRLTEWTRHREPHAIVTLNPEMYVAARDEAVGESLSRADLITPDGAGILAAADVARQLAGWPLPRWRWLMTLYVPFAWIWAGLRLIFTPHRLNLRRVTGADLVATIIQPSSGDKPRLALLGSTDEVMAKIKENFSAYEHSATIVLAETGSNFTAETVPDKEASHYADLLRPLRADYLLVAFGVPRQERFIIDRKRVLGVPVMIGVSGAFDSILAGSVRRAPKIIRWIHLEWLWRLILQPKRLGRIWTATWRFMLQASRDILAA